MRAVRRLAVALSMISAAYATEASADFIVGSYVLCRNAPAETGTVLYTLTGGDVVTVLEREPKWAKVQKTAQPAPDACWVRKSEVREPTSYESYMGRNDAAQGGMYNPSPSEAAGFLNRTPAPVHSSTSTYRAPSYSVPAATYKAPAKAKYSKTKARKAKRSSRRSTASSWRSISSSGSCPCSSGRICIGPRGGRYCITSGGNKRYGV